MRVTIKIRNKDDCKELQGEEGEELKSLLLENGFIIAFPCGGNKRCGRCRIFANTKPAEMERKILTNAELKQGIRLACCTKLFEGLDVIIPSQDAIDVLTTNGMSDYPMTLSTHELCLSLPVPSLEDQRSDLERVMAGCGAKTHLLDLEQLARLPELIHSSNPLFVLMRGKTLLNCSCKSMNYGAAIDIGTTTVQYNFINLNTGKIVSVLGEVNAQAVYGADIISRIKADMEWRTAKNLSTSPLQEIILEQIDNQLSKFIHYNNLDDLACISITGNTTMLHLLCGVPAKYISWAPFTPVFVDSLKLSARELGLHSHAVVYLMPSISSYVGADIVAALLAAEGWKRQPTFLLIDLGTNAETILGVNGVLYACSAAAGPCFEGVSLSCGMPAEIGAIDALYFDEDQGLFWSTIGDGPAVGLCGSGVISLMAMLLKHKLIDTNGRMEGDDSLLGQRIEGDTFFISNTVFLTQKDIREIQMAKAAVRAGIDVLLNSAQLKEEQVERIYLAGGFGSNLNTNDAAAIGLIPPHLADKSVVLGNAAAFGAVRYITESHAREYVAIIQRQTKYIELSNDERFTHAYVERMIFGGC